MKHFILTTLALAALIFGPASQAEILTAISDGTNTDVGESTVEQTPHVPGAAGIGIWKLGTNVKVDFDGLKNFGLQSNGVYIVVSKADPDDPEHNDMGQFTFAQAGSADVWYGEWSWHGEPDFEDRTVYYAGDDEGTLMPISGSAEYAVQGIHRFAGDNDANGTFTADFDASELTGSINNESLNFFVSADISGNSFTGSLFVLDNVTGAFLAMGSVQGHFFGNNATTLAGIATVSNGGEQYNIAFGGEYQ